MNYVAFLIKIYNFFLHRAGTAPHRSLPDIPKADDNNSDLYATVGDKVNTKPQGKESRKFFLPHTKKKEICMNFSFFSHKSQKTNKYLTT